jgi:hypothetical protein
MRKIKTLFIHFEERKLADHEKWESARSREDKIENQ